MMTDDAIFSAMDTDQGIMPNDSLCGGLHQDLGSGADLPVGAVADSTGDGTLSDILKVFDHCDGAAIMQYDDTVHGGQQDPHPHHRISLGSKRDDVLNGIKQAQSDIDYYTKKVAQLEQEQAEGWIVDSSLSYNKGYLDSAESRLHDLQRELSYLKD